MERGAFSDINQNHRNRGISEAITGFVLEQSVNLYENNLYAESELMRINFNNKDANNNTSVMATYKKYQDEKNGLYNRINNCNSIIYFGD